MKQCSWAKEKSTEKENPIEAYRKKNIQIKNWHKKILELHESCWSKKKSTTHKAWSESILSYLSRTHSVERQTLEIKQWHQIIQKTSNNTVLKNVSKINLWKNHHQIFLSRFISLILESLPLSFSPLANACSIRNVWSCVYLCIVKNL